MSGERDTASDECEHGDAPATCPPCRRSTGKDRPLGHMSPEVEFRFSARYPGDCTACHLPIYVGQPCARLTDGRTIHGDCE